MFAFMGKGWNLKSIPTNKSIYLSPFTVHHSPFTLSLYQLCVTGNPNNFRTFRLPRFQKLG